jgi:hypothetical protein
MRFTLKSTRLALRNSTTRIPFRYGKACMTCCPQAVMEAVIECESGVAPAARLVGSSRAVSGYSGDCLPPGWFDKDPARTYRQQIDDILAATAAAQQLLREEAARPTTLFDAWHAAYERLLTASRGRWHPLVASFALSFVERAVMDALARAAGMSFAQAVRENLYGIRPVAVHPSLEGLQPADWLPSEPRTWVHVRHTVGLSDPLTVDEIPASERVADGFPQALEEYVRQNGTRYLKVKLANRLEHDLGRLRRVAASIERHRGDDYRVTLDGNELYGQTEEFDELITALSSDLALRTLWQNTRVIEQPLHRHVALDPAHTERMRSLGVKPVIIDESDGTLHSYAAALELGYRGVSSKSCKGPIKSILNAGLTWLANDRGRRHDFLMTGEDLCTVGIVPVQADLCLAATLGLEHVERNGHHYHRGLSYLPREQQQAALAAHGDLYEQRGDVVAPAVRDGRFQIASLHCPGFGFAVQPDIDAMTPADEWRFETLGLPE